MECLRFSAPVPTATPFHFTKDVKLGKYKIKANDTIIVNIDAIHFNKNEW